MSHVTRHRAALVVLLGFLIASIVSTSVASAASISLLMRGRTYATTMSRCTDGPLTVVPSGTGSNGTFTQVKVTEIAGACTAGRVIVYQAASPNTVLALGTGTVSSSSMVVTTGQFVAPTTSAGRAFVMLDGWSVPATWTYTPPLSTVNTCEVRNVDDGTTDASTTCEVVIWESGFWPSGWFHAGFSAQRIGKDQYIAYQLTIPDAPRGWSWSNAGLTGVNQGSVTSSCSSLPTFSGQLDAKVGKHPEVRGTFVENRTDVIGIICSVP